MHLVLTPRLSGAEILVRDLCITQKQMGHITAFSAINPPEESFISEIDRLQETGVAIQIPRTTPSHLQRPLRIRKLLNEFKPDVVFAHSVIPAMYARIADPFSRRTIPVLHATENYPKGSPHRTVEHMLCHLSRSTIAVSKEGAQNFRSAFPTPIHVVRNGLDFTSAQTASARRQRRTQTSLIAIQVGRILPLKGQEISIRAMADVVKTHPKFELWLAGLIEDEEYYNKLKILIADLKLTSNIRFLGPRTDIYDLLSIADIFLMPSSAESQGLAMLEALATGIPVAASDIQTLKQFENMSMVSCLPRLDTAAWSSAIIASLHSPIFSVRDLSDFDIKRTAVEYIGIASMHR